MSYIQIEIGGKLRGLKFNTAAHTEYLTITDGVRNPVVHSCALIYGGLFANSIVKREEIDFTFEDVCDWCEKIKDPQVFIKIKQVYESTLPVISDNEKKNKVPKKSAQKSIKKKALK